MKFRKKPVVIEAVRWEGFVGDGTDAAKQAWPPGWPTKQFCRHDDEAWGPVLVIDTLEGRMKADVGDWIIRGVKGEFYPCKPDIFAATYESASAPAPVESRPVTCGGRACEYHGEHVPALHPAAPVESAPPRPKCATCSKPATCFGRYEVSSGPGAYACDDCCGHGNEDGVCLPLPPVESAPPGECCRRAQAEVNRLREGLGCITRATEVGEARGVAAALLLSTPESLTTPAEPPTDAQDDTERLVVQAAQNAYAAGRAWGAEAMREAAMRLPARVVFTEVAGLERLKLQGADRDDWLIRTTARKVLRQLSEHLARLPLPGAKEGAP